jgi:1-deoxy-D-xylulose-5-phosphate reductoisomerase
MSDIIEQCMAQVSYLPNPDLEDYVQTDIETRKKANEIING